MSAAGPGVQPFQLHWLTAFTEDLSPLWQVDSEQHPDPSPPDLLTFPLLPSQSVQSLSHVRLFVTPWTAARQASLSISNLQSLLKLMSIESMMPVQCWISSLFPYSSSSPGHSLRGPSVHWYAQATNDSSLTLQKHLRKGNPNRSDHLLEMQRREKYNKQNIH